MFVQFFYAIECNLYFIDKLAVSRNFVRRYRITLLENLLLNHLFNQTGEHPCIKEESFQSWFSEKKT